MVPHSIGLRIKQQIRFL